MHMHMSLRICDTSKCTFINILQTQDKTDRVGWLVGCFTTLSPTPPPPPPQATLGGRRTSGRSSPSSSTVSGAGTPREPTAACCAPTTSRYASGPPSPPNSLYVVSPLRAAAPWVPSVPRATGARSVLELQQPNRCEPEPLPGGQTLRLTYHRIISDNFAHLRKNTTYSNV